MWNHCELFVLWQANAETLSLWLRILRDSGRSDLVTEVIVSLHQGAFGISADPQHFAIALQALAESKDVIRGVEVYGLIRDKPEFSHYPFVLSAMLTLYGSMRMIGEAKQVFSLALRHGKVHSTIPLSSHHSTL